MKEIKLIFNRSEITAGTRGASLGPDAIRVAAWKKEKNLFDKYQISELKTENHLLNLPVKYQHAKRIEGLIKIYERLHKEINETLENKQFPLLISADHGSAGGTIAALKAHHPDKRIGVVWVDAHGDLHTPYTTPSGNMHGMPLSTALYEDNTEEQRNELQTETAQLWNQLKSIGFDGQKVLPEDLIFVGVRDVEKEEIALMQRLNIKNYEVAEIRKLGAKAVVDEINQKLSNCDLIYVSFDVDSMDPIETSHGTGTPVDNGLFIEETKTILKALVSNPKLLCFEMVEVNPCLDEKCNKMAEIAFEMLEDVIEIIEK